MNSTHKEICEYLVEEGYLYPDTELYFVDDKIIGNQRFILVKWSQTMKIYQLSGLVSSVVSENGEDLLNKIKFSYPAMVYNETKHLFPYIQFRSLADVVKTDVPCLVQFPHILLDGININDTTYSLNIVAERYNVIVVSDDAPPGFRFSGR